MGAWDVAKKHERISLSGDDTTMFVTSGKWASVIGSTGHSSGKRLFEVSTTGNINNVIAGCVNGLYSNLGTYIGASGTINEAAGLWFYNGRIYYNNGSEIQSGTTIPVGSVLGIGIDFDTN